MNTDLKLGHLKVIRIALTNQPLSRAVNETIDMVDLELVKHNIKVVYKSKPKRPYQRQPEGEYVFEEMTPVDHKVLQHKVNLK